MPRKDYVDRQLIVYFPSKVDRERWRDAARTAGIPLARYIIDMAELQANSGQASPRANAAQELAAVKKELESLKEELHVKSSLLERYETELYKLRHQPQVLPGGAASQDFSILAELLKTATHALNSQAILKGLRIDPRDSEAARLVWQQLQMLKQLGFAEENPEGWKWI